MALVHGREKDMSQARKDEDTYIFHGPPPQALLNNDMRALALALMVSWNLFCEVNLFGEDEIIRTAGIHVAESQRLLWKVFKPKMMQWSKIIHNAP